MEKSDYNELVNYALEANPLAFKQKFEDIMNNKIATTVDNIRQNLVHDMFNTPTEEIPDEDI